MKSRLIKIILMVCMLASMAAAPMAARSETVYWVPKGKSYHYTRDCRTLKRSKTIIEGTLDEAIKKGKSDPCDICAGG